VVPRPKKCLVATLATLFLEALGKIEPGADAKNAQKADKEVSDALKLDERLQKLGVDPILIGSYAPDVSIHRVKDVDVFVRLRNADDSLHPGDILTHTIEVLEDAFPGRVALDVFSNDERRQATAVFSLAPLAGDPRVTQLLAAGLGRLGSAACHWAVQLLALAAAVPAARDPLPVSVDALVRAADLMYDFDFDDFDSGVLSVYRLLKVSGVDAEEVVTRALRQASGDGVVLLLAMAVSLAGPGGSLRHGTTTAAKSPGEI
jgi:hypothetical protein